MIRRRKSNVLDSCLTKRRRRLVSIEKFEGVGAHCPGFNMILKNSSILLPKNRRVKDVPLDWISYNIRLTPRQRECAWNTTLQSHTYIRTRYSRKWKIKLEVRRVACSFSSWWSNVVFNAMLCSANRAKSSLRNWSNRTYGSRQRCASSRLYSFQGMTPNPSSTRTMRRCPGLPYHSTIFEWSNWKVISRSTVRPY